MPSMKIPHNPDAGLLLIRLGLAAVFIVHGLMKFNYMDGTISFFATLGLPAFMAWFVAALETLGGIAMLIGYKARVAGYLLAAVMAVAIILVKGDAGFVGGYEFDLMLLLAALGIALSGAGRYAVEKE
jgi:uncharacterized membrane protein YphA (DoxX/SURF4 family)